MPDRVGQHVQQPLPLALQLLDCHSVDAGQPPLIGGGGDPASHDGTTLPGNMPKMR